MIVSVILLLEIIFRLLPTTSPVDLQVITEKKNILKFYPNQIGRFSLGANFYKITERKQIIMAFIQVTIIFQMQNRILLLLVTRLYKLLKLKITDTMGELIQSERTNLKVYQFGVSGVSISQYIQMLKYTKKEFSPQHYVLVIVGNDFDESLCKYKIKPGTWCFNDDFDLEFNPFIGFKGFRNFMRKSATLRYIVFNVGLDWRAMLSMLREDEIFNINKILPKVGNLSNQNNSSDLSIYAGNTERFKSAEVTSNSKAAISVFLQELSKMDILDKVTVVIDADREDIYKDTVTYSYFNEMRKFMIDEMISYDVNYIDMDLIFRDDYKINKKSFEFLTDEHWNEYTHKMLSQILFNEYSILNK